MLVVQKSPLGGRPTQKHKFPLAADKEGNFGIRLGWLENGDPVIIKLSDAEAFGNRFNYTTQSFWKKIKNWI